MCVRRRKWAQQACEGLLYVVGFSVADETGKLHPAEKWARFRVMNTHASAPGGARAEISFPIGGACGYGTRNQAVAVRIAARAETTFRRSAQWFQACWRFPRAAACKPSLTATPTCCMTESSR